MSRFSSTVRMSVAPASRFVAGGRSSTSPRECARSMDTTSTGSPARAVASASAAARVVFPAPPFPRNHRTRAGACRTFSLHPLLEFLQRGVGDDLLRLALEQTDHRDREIHGELVVDDRGAVGGLGQHVRAGLRLLDLTALEFPAHGSVVGRPLVPQDVGVLDDAGVEDEAHAFGPAVGTMFHDLHGLRRRHPRRIGIEICDDLHDTLGRRVDGDRPLRLLGHVVTAPFLGPSGVHRSVPPRGLSHTVGTTVSGRRSFGGFSVAAVHRPDDRPRDAA